MEWYYAVGDDRRGPVSQLELGQLVTEGEVAATTLVWREGMEKWLPYREITDPHLGSDAVVKTNVVDGIRIPALVPGNKTMPLPDQPFATDYGLSLVGASHDVHLFPAILRPEETVKARAVLEEGESSCFYHPHLAATKVCDHSGRFICDLCAVDWEGGTISLQALEELKRTGKSDKLSDSRTMWDDIALSLATLPLITFFLPILTAPVALAICIWKWRAGPTGLTRRSRWRYWVAGILALLQIIFFGMMWLGVFNDW